MLSAPVPANEDLRLQDLLSFNILDSPEEIDYNDLAGLVAEICQCPNATISFIDKDRQWFKAKVNLRAAAMERKHSFCGHVIATDNVMVVHDALHDPRFFDNPEVRGGLTVRYYAGAPIISSSGYALGTVCVMDSTPRVLSDKQLGSLQTIARQVSRLLDLRVKNRQIVETATELVQAEKKLAQFNIYKREQENFKTAKLLHEDIAQSTAAVRLYMHYAKSSKELSGQFLDHSIEELGRLMDTITKLSRSISPTTFGKDNYADHIEKLVLEYGTEHNIAVSFNWAADVKYLNGHKGLLIYRISQDLLGLARHSGSRELTLSFTSERQLDIFFTYREEQRLSAGDARLLESNIESRVNMLRGSLHKTMVPERNERLIHIRATGSAFKKNEEENGGARSSTRSGL